MKGCISAQRLKELLDYDPETGVFTNRVQRNYRSKQGVEVGYLNPTTGYLQVTLDGSSYWVHRLAWLYVHGVLPEGRLDHKNEAKTDNRISNLRPASHSTNMRNRWNAHADNACGFLGVSRMRSRFLARIVVDGRQRSLGVFDTPGEAHEAYLLAKTVAHPDAICKPFGSWDAA